MAKFSKFQKTSVGHLFKHYARELDSNGEPIKYSNGSIDVEKSNQNYNLAKEIQPLGQKEFLEKRLSDPNLKVMKRKDVKVVCEWIVTVPKDLPKEKEEEFFKTTFDYLSSVYGKENVVSAYVHKDETTPHLHFAFIPVYFNEKKQEYRVSANDKIKRSDLKSFHKKLQNYCESQMGCEVNIENGATKNGNLTVEQLKANKKLEEATAVTISETKKVQKEIDNALLQALTIGNETKTVIEKLQTIQNQANEIKIKDVPEEFINWIDNPEIATFKDGSDRPYMEQSIFEIVKKWIAELTALLGLQKVTQEIQEVKSTAELNLNKISTIGTQLSRSKLSLDKLQANVSEIQKHAKKSVKREKTKEEH